MKPPRSKAKDKREPDERITLFPSLAYYDEKRGGWRALIQGRVYDLSRIPISTRILLKGLKRALKATEEELAGEIFRQRIQGFTATPIGGRTIRLDFAGHPITLRKKSKRSGAFFSIVKLPEGLVPHPDQLGDEHVPPVPIRLQRDDHSLASCQPGVLSETAIHVLPPRGISIVSDIDDTIKATEVGSRHAMLANTFLRPFMAIDGMAELYQRWHEAGAAFHYVSSSPWQLFQPLAELCHLSRFPAGSMHLRYFRIRDEMFRRWRPARRKGKAGIIAGLMRKLPERRFVLVGDSGERDPEIYRFLAQKFPEQVTAILIRQLDAKPLSPRRIEKLKEVPGSVEVRLFQEAGDLLSFGDILLQ
ncbi:MAG: phosphatidate phosphatase App1 family protein [Aureliella sp.]